LVRVSSVARWLGFGRQPLVRRVPKFGRQSPVADPDARLPEEDVAGDESAVGDVLAVGAMDRLCDLRDDSGALLDRQVLGFRAEIPARRVLGCDPRSRVETPRLNV